MIRLLTILFLSCLISESVSAQDPVFSQFYAAPIQLNPAFAGTTIEPRVTLNYRNEWSAWEQPAYVTYAASYEQFVESVNSGLGIMVQSDNAGNGIYKTTKFSAAYGYRLQINRDFFIKFGAEAGLTQSRLDWNKLLFGDQLHPIHGEQDPSGNPYFTNEVRPLNNSLTYLDISAGLLAYSKNFYIGISTKHLNTPDETILGLDDNLNGGLPLRLNIHAGYELPLNTGNNRKSKSFISPNIMLIRQGDFGQVNAGAYAGFGSFFGGLWYRHAWSNPDAAIVLLGYQLGVLKVGYSYDFTIAKADFTVAETGGTHEISLVFNFDNSESAKRKRRSSQYNDCFNLFR